MTEKVVVIGAGQAAGAFIGALNQFGFAGEITLVGEEPDPPYQRPPLSKAYLKGEMPKERLYLKPYSYYDDNDITLRLSCRVTKIDKEFKRITLDNGESLPYDKLVIATGSRPRSLPVEGARAYGVQALRTLQDVEHLKPRVKTGGRMLIIGAGYIGLEAAAVARQLGLDVVVLEAADRVLARVAGPTISDFYTELHRGNGVDLRLGAKLEALIEENGELKGGRLADGEIILAEIALIGVGVIPNDDLARAAGIECADGVVVDEVAATSDSNVYAIGDCTRRPISLYGVEARLESVHNANEQGRLAAAAVAGKPSPKTEAPWFWSDQYDVKLQTVGLLTGFDREVVRGDPSAGSFAVWYLDHENRVLAVDAVNSPPDFVCAKKLVAARAIIDSKALTAPDLELKAFTNESLSV